MPRGSDEVGNPGLVIVAPAWHSCGSYEVFRAQIQTFERLGFAVYFLAVPSISQPSRHDKKFWRHYREMTQNLGARQRGHTARGPLAYARPRGLRALLASYRGSFVNSQTLAARLAPVPGALKKFILRNPVKAVICNHYFNMPLAEAVRDLAAKSGERPKLVLETHDIQSRHYVSEGKIHSITRRRSPQDAMMADEISIAAAADALVHLNEGELDVFKTKLPGHPHVLIYPPMPRRWDPAVAAAGYEADAAKRFDFLIVASSNFGNYRNLCWFLDEVWSPAFDARFNLKIVGNVDYEFTSRKDPRYGKYRYSFIGRVESLDWYYHNCRAVLLPVVEGQGVAIKTIEALSYGKPIVGTQLAFRGFPASLDVRTVSGFAADARSFRRAVSDIGDGDCQAINWEAIELYEALFSNEVHLLRYRDFFQHLKIQLPKSPGYPAVSGMFRGILPPLAGLGQFQ